MPEKIQLIGVLARETEFTAHSIYNETPGPVADFEAYCAEHLIPQKKHPSITTEKVVGSPEQEEFLCPVAGPDSKLLMEVIFSTSVPTRGI